mmetsp:Transcript_19878/g.55391  ORF Transcript_19878/g.55391 Transcript_19878/m.55391 type:complete len:122 (-) Transcript_19878:202-567(-)
MLGRKRHNLTIMTRNSKKPFDLRDGESLVAMGSRATVGTFTATECRGTHQKARKVCAATSCAKSINQAINQSIVLNQGLFLVRHQMRQNETKRNAKCTAQTTVSFRESALGREWLIGFDFD